MPRCDAQVHKDLDQIELPLEKERYWLESLSGKQGQEDENIAVTGSICISLRTKGLRKQRRFLSAFESLYDKVGRGVVPGCVCAWWSPVHT